MNARCLVVSIHDVSPFTRETVGRMIGELGEIGAARLSLLVVPDHHRRGNITADPAFGAWLREQVAAGHEAALHGYYHRRERREGEGARTQFFTRIYTADEGEFFDIAYDDARQVLARGRADLAQVSGVAPRGFIAPAWLLSAEGERAARDVGFEYTTRLKSVSALQTGALYQSQSLCWSVRGGLRRVVSLEWNALLFGRLRANDLMRISIHPPDIAYPEIWRQIRTLVGRAVLDREPVGYGDFVRMRNAGK
jgi:hypothetical protein